MKQKTKLGLGIITLATLTTLMLLSGLVTADTECSSQDCSVDTSLTIDNVAPTITEVQSGITITLTGESTTNTETVWFNVSDENGKDDINDSTAVCTGYKSGEEDRISSSCSVTTEDGNWLQINCTIEDFAYYDIDGADWKWNCTVDDNASETATNDTETFTINALNYIDQDLTTLTWGSIASGTDDQEADAPINLDNGGNQDYASCSVTAYNSTYTTNIIPATAFYLNNETGTPAGTQMADETPVAITSWFTLTHGLSANEDIFAYVDTPTLPAGVYTSTSGWLVDITT